MKILTLFSCIVVAALTASAWADDGIATLRKGHAIADQMPAAPMSQVENKDLKRKRAYPMQPPTIPHKIENYQIDTRSNQCMACHSRKRVEDSKAPMVSVTHYMDRDGNFLASISPRRYFCLQCHVPQEEVKAPVENTFKDVDHLLTPATEKQ